jgi:hypothetical protein
MSSFLCSSLCEHLFQVALNVIERPFDFIPLFPSFVICCLQFSLDISGQLPRGPCLLIHFETVVHSNTLLFGLFTLCGAAFQCPRLRFGQNSASNYYIPAAVGYSMRHTVFRKQIIPFIAFILQTPFWPFAFNRSGARCSTTGRIGPLFWYHGELYDRKEVSRTNATR